MLSNVSGQNAQPRNAQKVEVPPPPPPRITPPQKVINEMDLALSNDYRSLKSLEQMIRSSPEKVIPPWEAPRLLQKVSQRLRQMKKSDAGQLIKAGEKEKKMMTMILDDSINDTLKELAL